MTDAQALLKEYSAVKAKKAPWNNLFELVARYVLTRKQGFTDSYAPGEFLVHGDVYDSTAVRANNIMGSSLLGALWRNGARTFKMVRPRHIAETEEVKQYYAEINRRAVYQMEHQRAGLEVSLQEYMADQGAFGTAGVGVFAAKPGSDNLLEYKAFCVKNMCICEGAGGYVSKIFIEFEMAAAQIVEEYGAVGNKDVMAALEANDYEKKFKVIWIIRPRSFYNPSKADKSNMPWESIHILEKDKSIIRESGFKRQPIKVARFYKNQDEEYGRSPAMEALPDIIELNAIWEMITKAAEKQLHPPLYLLDDGSFGGGIIDQSPNAFNIIDISTRITNTNPIGVVGTVGELNSSLKMVEQLVNQIMSHFFVDRLLDLNNKTRMTLGEAEIRNELRSESLGSIFGRQLNELFTPLIESSFDIMFDAGEMGVVKGSPEEKALLAQGKVPLYIPQPVFEAMIAGQDIYEIQYISPAARMLRTEELRGIMTAWQFAGTYAEAVPEMILRLDAKRSTELVAELGGAPMDILLSEESYQEALSAYREAQKIQAQQSMEANMAKTRQADASGMQQEAQAEATRKGMNGAA